MWIQLLQKFLAPSPKWTPVYLLINPSNRSIHPHTETFEKQKT